MLDVDKGVLGPASQLSLALSVEPPDRRALGYVQDRPRSAHLAQPSALRSHFTLAVEQCMQAFCREVAYLEAFMMTLESRH